MTEKCVFCEKDSASTSKKNKKLNKWKESRRQEEDIDSVGNGQLRVNGGEGRPATKRWSLFFFGSKKGEGC